MAEEEVIIKTALFSRLSIILLQYISNLIIPDHEADAFRYPRSPDNGLIDQFIHHVLGGFVRWDSQYFMHIARFGYTYEQNLAFFPFYPIIVRYMALTLSNFMFFLSLDSLILVTFITVNVLCFLLSALCLYKLSVLVIGKDLAFKATVLFCYNPASVFFTAPYTECVFSYLSFKSMLNCILLYRKYSDVPFNLQVRDVLSIIPICLSTITRSNGILNVGFLVYTLICLYLRENQLRHNGIIYFIRFVLVSLLLILCCVLPFILFQIYSYVMFCNDFETSLPHIIMQQAKEENFVLPGTFSQHNQSWCFKKVPMSYLYVQSHYWKVGFLRYYELKQIPNFILAFPIIFIIFHETYRFVEQFPKRINALFNFDLISGKNVCGTKFKPVMAVFVIHAAALTAINILNIHVQVTTRMLCSASPVLYWFSSYYASYCSECTLFKKLFCKDCSVGEYYILIYFLSYFVIGTIMFCNYLPWT